MRILVKRLATDYPDFQFVVGETASWSPTARQITYIDDTSEAAAWSLLHELGHALLDHTSYKSDINLLQKEAAAWQKAQMISNKYNIAIAEWHIQECLDSYRDWLHKRSTCPHCENHGIQSSERRYNCLNCRGTWQVSEARFCRPYRLKISQNIK